MSYPNYSGAHPFRLGIGGQGWVPKENRSMDNLQTTYSDGCGDVVLLENECNPSPSSAKAHNT